MGSKTAVDKVELSTISSLLGIEAQRILLGYLTMPREDAWFLEDLGSVVALDFSSVVEVPERLYTVGSIVILQGCMVGTVFKVQAIALPPAEARGDTLLAMGLVDAFGNGTRQQQQMQMQELESVAHEALFVIMSDVLIDKPHVMEKLQSVFEG